MRIAECWFCAAVWANLFNVVGSLIYLLATIYGVFLTYHVFEISGALPSCTDVLRFCALIFLV